MSDENAYQPSSSEPSVPVIPSPAPSSNSVPQLGTPTLRPALAGRPSGARTPRLGLSIPPSPAPKSAGAQPASRPALPTMHIPTAASQKPPQQQLKLQIGPQPGHSATGSESSHSRSASFDGRGSHPTSADSMPSSESQYHGVYGTPDPTSAAESMRSDFSEGGVPMGRDPSLQGLEAFDKLTLEKARTADVEDLDDEAWTVASREGRIEQLGNLGEGAGGAVTKCKLKGGSMVFALKVITSNPDPDVKKQIIRELDFNKTCASEHICRYYGTIVDPSASTISIAMECCEGGSLDSVYKEVKKLGGRTGEKVLGKISEGVLGGLIYLHDRRIIHRDIKPSNILLCRDGAVKLCDFGVSGEFGTNQEAGTFIGTSYYMAPERITGQKYTINSDVWSTGVTLLEVAQHRFPFPADGTEAQPKAGLMDLLVYIVQQPVPVLKDEPDKDVYWSDNFKYFISCCLERDPTRRASPKKMLEHPWMVDMKSKRVNMVKYLSFVWGWDDAAAKDE